MISFVWLHYFFCWTILVTVRFRKAGIDNELLFFLLLLRGQLFWFSLMLTICVIFLLPLIVQDSNVIICFLFGRPSVCLPVCLTYQTAADLGHKNRVHVMYILWNREIPHSRSSILYSCFFRYFYSFITLILSFFCFTWIFGIWKSVSSQ